MYDLLLYNLSTLNQMIFHELSMESEEWPI